MILAYVIYTDEGNLICDLAETYGVLNYKGLPPSTVGALFLGLRDNSRTKMKLSGQKLTIEQILLAQILDGVNFLVWSKTADAKKNRNRPKSALQILLGTNKENEYETFSTPQELMEYFDSLEKGKE